MKYIYNCFGKQRFENYYNIFQITDVTFETPLSAFSKPSDRQNPYETFKRFHHAIVFILSSLLKQNLRKLF